MTDLPAPPVPADCDLRDLQWMALDVSRLRDSELAAADAEVFRVAVLSWCASWHQVPAASLPDDDAILARLLGFGRDVKGFKKIRAAGGLRGWTLHADGRLYHAVVAAKATEAMEQKRRAATKRERDAERLRNWRERSDETRSGNANETRFVAERPDQTLPDQTISKKNPPPPPSADSASEEKSQKTPAAATAAQLSIRVKSQNIGKIRNAVQSGSLMGLVRAYGGNTARGEEWTREAGEYQLGTILAVLDWRAKHRQPIREPSGLRTGLAAWHEQPQDFRRKWIADLLAELGLTPAQEGAA